MKKPKPKKLDVTLSPITRKEFESIGFVKNPNYEQLDLGKYWSANIRPDGQMMHVWAVGPLYVENLQDLKAVIEKDLLAMKKDLDNALRQYDGGRLLTPLNPELEKL